MLPTDQSRRIPCKTMRTAVLLVLLGLSSCLLASVRADRYEVTARRLNDGMPVLSPAYHDMDWDYCYNPTAFQRGGVCGLLVRCQSQDPQHRHGDLTPSVVVASTTPCDGLDATQPVFAFTELRKADVVLQPHGEDEEYGVEDPRVVQLRAATGASNEADADADADADASKYYMLYSAVKVLKRQPLEVLSVLTAAVSTAPDKPGSWTRLGPVFPELGWTKSGAIMQHQDPSRGLYLMFGDDDRHTGIRAAHAPAPAGDAEPAWTLLHGGKPMLTARPGHFDSGMVEGGPEILPLSATGDYLMIYNSARHGYPSPTHGYDFQYNIGYAILSKSDPTHVIMRSDVPLLSPELSWEVYGLTTNVVFAEAIRRVPSTDACKDRFLIFYGAADTHVGAAELCVNLRI